MHAVYYLQSPGEEFRFSLRSIGKNLPVKSLTIIGDAPDWLKNAEVLSGNPTANPFINSVANAHIAARAFPDTFTLFNDDFFVLEPVKEIPDYFLTSLSQDAGKYIDPKSVPIKQLYINTAKYLTNERVTLPRSFEVHTPMTVVGKELDRILTASAASPHLQGPGLWRSLYGNLMNLEGVKREDVKFHTLGQLPGKLDYLSTHEATFKNFLPMLKERFPRKSRWEK